MKLSAHCFGGWHAVLIIKPEDNIDPRFATYFCYVKNGKLFANCIFLAEVRTTVF